MESEDYKDIENLNRILAPLGPGDADCEEDDDYENAGSGNERSDDHQNDNEEVMDPPNPYLDFDEIQIDRNEPNPQVCKSLGNACFDILYIVEKQLITLLERCRTKMKEIQEQINSAKNPATKTSTPKGNWYYIFGIPYFKDHNYFHCPPNEDQLQKLANRELNIIDLPTLRQWKPANKMKLEQAIKFEEIRKRISAARTRKQAILKAQDTSDSAILELQMLDECDLTHLKSKTLAELVGTDRKEYDWMKISAQDMQGYHSPEECRALWHNYLHPKIRKSKWSTEEDNRLIELANKYRRQDWDAIAHELGTQRSGYQCMCQYQTRLNDSLRKSRWTKKEDDTLKLVVESCRIGSYIPWTKVTSCMEGRSKSQVFNRWTYSINPAIKRGRFTKDEDILIVAAVRRYGTDDFKRVARFVPGRTSIQVRDRYNGFLKRQAGSLPWTHADDSLLLSLVKQYGEGNWSKISESFANRTRTQIRHRYTTIMNWMMKKPNDKGQIFVPTRRLTVDPCREVQVWNKVQNILGGIKSSTDINETNLMKLKEKFETAAKKRPGRKLGQKKSMTELDKEYLAFFRCAYVQSGGRKKLHYDEALIQRFTQIVKLMLLHFQARITIPNDEACIDNEKRFNASDRRIIHNLRDENRLLLMEEASSSVQNNEITTTGPIMVEETSIPKMIPVVVKTVQSRPISQFSTTHYSFPLSSASSTPEVSYLCPPNHTTLVGFRTLLLSRRNFNEKAGIRADSVRRRVLDISDFDDGSEDHYSTNNLSPETASSLWYERMFSLFLWPAVMSNIIPTKSEGKLFGTDHPSTSYKDVKNLDVKPSETTDLKKITIKKRKHHWKKKYSEISNPQKKRKYEKTGKYKKTTPNEPVEPRRSARRQSRSICVKAES